MAFLSESVLWRSVQFAGVFFGRCGRRGVETRGGQRRGGICPLPLTDSSLPQKGEPDAIGFAVAWKFFATRGRSWVHSVLWMRQGGLPRSLGRAQFSRKLPRCLGGGLGSFSIQSLRQFLKDPQSKTNFDAREPTGLRARSILQILRKFSPKIRWKKRLSSIFSWFFGVDL